MHVAFTMGDPNTGVETCTQIHNINSESHIGKSELEMHCNWKQQFGVWQHKCFVSCTKCMYVFCVVINHLDLHWTLSHIFITITEPGNLRESDLFLHRGHVNI